MPTPDEGTGGPTMPAGRIVALNMAETTRHIWKGPLEERSDEAIEWIISDMQIIDRSSLYYMQAQEMLHDAREEKYRRYAARQANRSITGI